MTKNKLLLGTTFLVLCLSLSACSFSKKDAPEAKVFDVADTLRDNLNSIGIRTSQVVKMGPSPCRTIEENGENTPEQNQAESTGKEGVYWSASFSIRSGSNEEAVRQFTKDILSKKNADMNLVEIPDVSISAGDNKEQYKLYPTSDFFNENFDNELDSGYFFEASTGCFPN